MVALAEFFRLTSIAIPPSSTIVTGDEAPKRNPFEFLITAPIAVPDGTGSLFNPAPLSLE